MSTFTTRFLFACLLIVSNASCGGRNENDGREAGTGLPTSVDAWDDARLFRLDDVPNGQCGETEFTVLANGTWSLKRCDHRDAGTMTNAELAQLNASSEATLASTAQNPCAQVLKLNANYV